MKRGTRSTEGSLIGRILCAATGHHKWHPTKRLCVRCKRTPEQMKIDVPCEHDSNIFADVHEVRCPCDGCDGTLFFETMNKLDSLAFLECGTCRCAYRAERRVQ